MSMLTCSWNGCWRNICMILFPIIGIDRLECTMNRTVNPELSCHVWGVCRSLYVYSDQMNRGTDQMLASSRGHESWRIGYFGTCALFTVFPKTIYVLWWRQVTTTRGDGCRMVTNLLCSRSHKSCLPPHCFMSLWYFPQKAPLYVI